MPSDPPRRLEVYAEFRIPLGPRSEAAGLRVRFQHDDVPGIHFTVEPDEEYRAALLHGIEDGMAARFPDFLASGSIWITEITAHEVDSSQRAFYRVGRLVVDQAFSLTQTAQGLTNR